jgi:hypothetical protein
LASDGLPLANAFFGQETFAEPVVFDLKGKKTMLENGIGSVRLAPFRTDDGVFWFCSASSIGWSDQGIPVVIPDTLYQEIFPEIRDKGSMLASIKGRLRVIYANNDTGVDAGLDNYVKTTIFDSYHGMSRVYVAVEDVKRLKARGPKIGLKASAAVSFTSCYESTRPKMYGAYVAFSPGMANSLENAVQWMAETYVVGRY